MQTLPVTFMFICLKQMKAMLQSYNSGEVSTIWLSQKKRKLQLVEWEWAVQFPTVLQKSEKLQKLRTGSQYNLLLDSCFFPLQKCEKLQKLQLEDRGTILHCVAKK